MATDERRTFRLSKASIQNLLLKSLQAANDCFSILAFPSESSGFTG